jgi:hypothetical protein
VALGQFPGRANKRQLLANRNGLDDILQLLQPDHLLRETRECDQTGPRVHHQDIQRRKRGAEAGGDRPGVLQAAHAPQFHDRTLEKPGRVYIEVPERHRRVLYHR